MAMAENIYTTTAHDRSTWSVQQVLCDTRIMRVASHIRDISYDWGAYVWHDLQYISCDITNITELTCGAGKDRASLNDFNLNLEAPINSDDPRVLWDRAIIYQRHGWSEYSETFWVILWCTGIIRDYPSDNEMYRTMTMTNEWYTDIITYRG
jgi:hypothetical protein